MKITYLGHSGFSVELKKCVLLFDYYKGKLPAWEKDKPISIFVSHKHQDHFQLTIFELARHYSHVHYFLGSDVKLSDKYLMRNGVEPAVKEKITHTGKDIRLAYEGLSIRTLRSTDAGVAYVVEAEEKRIYHAGDLNWWHWEGESEAWNRNMERNYKMEIDKLEGEHFDLAFVPLDPRLGSAYGWGINYYMEKTDTDRLFPMHLWGEYETVLSYKKSGQAQKFADRIMPVEREGQEWKL